jgi:hypothetical protein
MIVSHSFVLKPSPNMMAPRHALLANNRYRQRGACDVDAVVD